MGCVEKSGKGGCTVAIRRVGLAQSCSLPLSKFCTPAALPGPFRTSCRCPHLSPPFCFPHLSKYSDCNQRKIVNVRATSMRVCVFSGGAFACTFSAPKPQKKPKLERHLFAHAPLTLPFHRPFLCWEDLFPCQHLYFKWLQPLHSRMNLHQRGGDLLILEM